MVGCLGLLHKEGQAVGLYGNWAYQVVGLGPKATVLTMPFFFFFSFFFRSEVYALLVGEKYRVLGP